MTTQSEIIAANRASAEREAQPDWAKEDRRIEFGAERLLCPAPKRSLYFRENTKEDFLSEIVAENVKASRQ
jgi:hypothetical protein